MGEATLVQFPPGLELGGGLVQEEMWEREWDLSSPRPLPSRSRLLGPLFIIHF